MFGWVTLSTWAGYMLGQRMTWGLPSFVRRAMPGASSTAGSAAAAAAAAVGLGSGGGGGGDGGVQGTAGMPGSAFVPRRTLENVSRHTIRFTLVIVGACLSSLLICFGRLLCDVMCAACCDARGKDSYEYERDREAQRGLGRFSTWRRMTKRSHPVDRWDDEDDEGPPRGGGGEWRPVDYETAWPADAPRPTHAEYVKHVAGGTSHRHPAPPVQPQVIYVNPPTVNVTMPAQAPLTKPKPKSVPKSSGGGGTAVRRRPVKGQAQPKPTATTNHTNDNSSNNNNDDDGAPPPPPDNNGAVPMKASVSRVHAILDQMPPAPTEVVGGGGGRRSVKPMSD